jgi:hypothetical protein
LKIFTDKGRSPDLQRAFDLLFAEHQFPIFVAHRHHWHVIFDVKVLLALRFLLLRGQERQLVVAVEITWKVLPAAS